MLIGYARVSTQEQETHAQIDALTLAGCDTIYQEKRSGGSMSRPVLLQMLESLTSGDTVVVYKLDRVARSLSDLLQIVDGIGKVGADFNSLTEHFDTSTPAGRLVFQLLGAMAEFERELIRERTRVGMAAAKARGSVFGRPKAMHPADEAACVADFLAGKSTKLELARRYDCDVSSVKRAIARYRAKAQPDLFRLDHHGALMAV